MGQYPCGGTSDTLSVGQDLRYCRNSGTLHLGLLNGGKHHPVIVAIIAKDTIDFVRQFSRKLKVRVAIRISMRAVDAMIGIDFDE